MSEYFGLIEMGFVFAAVFGFLGWQYWTVRDAGKPKDSPVESGHPEGEHHPHNR